MMNVKTKTALIIILTLLIGILLGAGLHRLYLQHRLRRIVNLQRPFLMTRMMERVIQPSPKQREEIQKILRRHTQRLLDIRRDFEEKMRKEVEAIRQEIDPLLTPQQKKWLERRFPPPYRRWLRQTHRVR